MFYIILVKEFSFLGNFFYIVWKYIYQSCENSLLFYKYGTLYTMHTITGKSIFISEYFSCYLFLIYRDWESLFLLYMKVCPFVSPQCQRRMRCYISDISTIQHSLSSNILSFYLRYLLYLIKLNTHTNMVTHDQTV